MVKIILVRHGESFANETGTFAGQFDYKLTNRGIEQAKLTASWLYDNYKVNAVYTSDLSRAYDTAKIIANRFGLQPVKEQGLREINSGDWQGKGFGELKNKGDSEWNVWLSDIGNVKCLNGESVKDLYDRVFNTVKQIIENNEGKTVVIVSHATPIRTLCCRFKGYDVSDMKKVSWVSNSSVTEVDINGDNWVLVKESVDNYLLDLSTRFKANV